MRRVLLLGLVVFVVFLGFSMSTSSASIGSAVAVEECTTQPPAVAEGGKELLGRHTRHYPVVKYCPDCGRERWCCSVCGQWGDHLGR